MKQTILKQAAFSPKVKPYWMLNGIIICVVTVIGIPFLLLWIPLAAYFIGRYLDRMECVLKTRELVVKKGILNRTEKTIPLEKITDLGLQQGPIMRHFGIHMLTVETAGQSSAGSLASLVGIVDVEDFREAVLTQRDKIADKDSGAAAPVVNETLPKEDLLAEIRDCLLRIEEKLDRK